MGTESPLPKDLWDRVPSEAQALICALLERMAHLEARVKSLEEENRRLRERVNQNSMNSSKPPSSDPPSVKRRPPQRPTGRKRGGQAGHPRHQRVLVPAEQVSETWEIKPEACRRCGHRLEGEDPEPLRHQVAELPPVQPIVEEYRLHRLRCPQCGTTTCGQLPVGVPPGWFGPRLQAVFSLLAGAYRLSKRAIQALAADLFGLSISLGMISKLEQATAAVLECPYHELREYVRGQHAGVDETSWRENRGKAWLWVVVAGLVTVFRIASSRGAEVARQLLGADYPHVATCDRWKSYLWIRRCQLCWSHLRRDFQAMIDRDNSGSKIGRALLKLSDQLFPLWHRLREGTLARSTLQKRVGPLRRCVQEQLERGARCRCPQTAATCGNLLSQEKKLWTFVWVEGIEPTNNQSERSLRHAVLWRKTSGGTNSPAGSRFVERMLTVVATCRQQHRNVLEFLTHCCQARLQGTNSPTLLPQVVRVQKAA
jgi:transposase